MKKFLFGLATLVLFASCSQNETIEVSKGNAIEFQNAFVDNATRSAYDPSITKSTLGAFYVYGFMDETSAMVFNKEKVSSTDGGSTWSYQNKQYWSPDHTYYFAALAPVDKYTLDITNVNKEGIGKVTFVNDGKTDLLYDALSVTTPATLTSQPAAVAFTFRHLLSKVKFSFVNSLDNANATIRVKAIKITNAHTDAKIDLANLTWWTNLNAWDIDDTKEATFDFGNAAVASASAEEKIMKGTEIESYNEMLLFPQEAEELTVKFTIELLYGDKVADTYDHTLNLTQTLKMGYCYDFKATVTARNIDPNAALYPIEFTVTEVNNWMQEGNPAGEVSVTLPTRP